MKVKKELPGIKKNIPLKNYTTFRIGGPAKYFFIAKTKEDLIKAILVAKKFYPAPNSKSVKDKIFNKEQNGGGVFILGGGSNLLISDKGLKGLVIKILNTKYKILNTKIVAEAGTILGQLVSASEKAGLAGLEWAVGIPGTVGGAIYGNAGAFRKSIKEVVKEVEVFDTKTQKIKILKKKDCKFGYRDSVFKRNPNLIILSATLELKKGNKKEIQKKMKEYLNYRKETQPLDYHSAGSIFKNPPGFSAGELIEKCGLKGKKIGKAQISKKHANFIVNLRGATSKDVKKLINLAKKKVKKKFKINLEEEICYLGF